MAISFDPDERRVILDTAVVSAAELWARWAEWVASADNAKYLPALRSVGGDDLGGGVSIPFYFFLLNGWRVRPMEGDHDLAFTGNLFVDGGGAPFVRTVGPYQVSIRSTVPVQAQAMATSGSAYTPAQIADAVWGKVLP